MSTRNHKSKRKTRKAAATVMSEMVHRRARDTNALLASIRVHKSSVATALGDRHTPALETGEALPDYELPLDLTGRTVRNAFVQLDDVDHEHDRAKANRAHLARELDRLTKDQLYPQAVAVRRQIDVALGAAGADLHTFTGKTPRSSGRLKEHVKRALLRLGDPNRPLPSSSKVASEPIDREAWKQRLEKPYQALEVADGHLRQQEIELSALKQRRRDAMKRFDAVYSESLALVKATFQMAGLDRRMIKSLKPQAERRRLSLWARRKRHARANQASALAATGEDLERAPEPTHRLGEGAIATISRWFQWKRIFG